MSIEGLQSILDKKEVVPTFSVQDLVERPAQVEADYLYHVRTYVPVNRAADGKEGQITVEEFEKRLIKQVKEGKVPRGYITAGYGYGKTTTALYMWKRAQDANIVIVPPFTLSQLPDFLHAVYGWLRYKLGQTRPALIERLETLYKAAIDRSLERITESYGLAIDQAQSLLKEGRLLLELRANDYLDFFEKSTQIALDAGYEGLVVLPDEIQQYFRPKLKEGGDPIAPFFGIIQLLNTRASTSSLRFGFIMIITLEELAQIRDTFRRNDLLHRMKDLQIDLTSLYDHQFAPNLWHLMAKQFDFEAEKAVICDDATLDALGEISARNDISDGPRTVINVFARMVGRFVDSNGQLKPYSPIDLMTDFLDEQAISFAGDDKLRRVLRRALDSHVVRDDPDRYGPAVKLAAAFPTDGVSRAIQRRYDQANALDELMRKAIGDLVQAGLQGEGAVKLTGLSQEKERTSWLPATVREFRLGYNEHATITRDRAEEAFIALLTQRVFTNSRWKLIRSRNRSFVLNRSLIFEGAFDSLKAEYPKRAVHVRLLWQDEAVKDSNVDGDVCIEYQLYLPTDMDDDARRSFARPAEDRPDEATARIPLNLLYHRTEDIPQNLQKELEDVWSPFDLSPLVLANIYQLIEEKRKEGDIPKKDDSLILNGFQPTVLDTLMKLLFNAQVGQDLGVAGTQITEQAVGYMLKARYPNYQPLITAQQWNSSLTKYENALGQLEQPDQRTGETVVSTKKEDLAKLFTLSNTGFDSFTRSFPTLLLVAKDFRGESKGEVYFTQHPMEKTILGWLRNSKHAESVNRKGRAVTIHRISTGVINRDAMSQGYLEEEVKALLSLLEKRGLVEQRDGWLIEVIADDYDLSELRQLLRTYDHDLDTLLDAFGSSAQLIELKAYVDEKFRPALKEVDQQRAADPNVAAKLANTLLTRQKELLVWAKDQRLTLKNRYDKLTINPLPKRIVEGLANPINPGLVAYVDQVNVLRNALAREMEKVKSELELLSQKVTKSRNALLALEFNYNDLALTARALNQHEDEIHQAHKMLASLEHKFDHYYRWHTLVQDGVKFKQALQNLPPNDVSELQQEFDKLSTAIRSEISSQSNKLDALELHQTLSARLAELLSAAQARSEKRRLDFDDFQRDLKAILKRNPAFQHDVIQAVSFNPTDVESAYQQVRRIVKSVLSNRVRDIEKTAATSRQALDNIGHRTQELSESKRDEIEHQAQSLLVDSAGVQQALTDIGQQIDIANLAETEQLNALVDTIARLDSQQREWQSQVQRLNSQFSAASPTSEEKRLLMALHERSGDDIVALKSAFGGDEESFWRALQGLYRKNYLLLNIQVLES